MQLKFQRNYCPRAVGQNSKIHVCIFGLKGVSTSKVIGTRNEMMMGDYDGQMIFGDPVGLKLPDIRLTGEEKPRKNLTQEACPDRGSNPGPLRDKPACYHLLHSGGQLDTKGTAIISPIHNDR